MTEGFLWLTSKMEKGYVFYSAAFIILGCLGSFADDVMMYHYSSTYGVLCSNTCDKHGEDYYWCKTRKGWDYCSPVENRDYEDKACRDDHPCGKYGKSYYWCYRNKSWGYCGPVESKRIAYISSTYQQVCNDECLYDKSYEYYWCNTDKGWDYCSPAENIDHENYACRDDHPCDKHGESYYWCYTNRWLSNWGYCGPVDPNYRCWITELEYDYCQSPECSYLSTKRRKRLAKPNNAAAICVRKDTGNRRETTFLAEPNPGAVADGSSSRNEITDLIARWENGCLVNQARSNVLYSPNFRIDIQGLVNRGNQPYYNLQVQQNVRRDNRESTTVSQVLIPANTLIPDRYVRHAFVESFRRRARVIVEYIMPSTDPENPEKSLCTRDKGRLSLTPRHRHQTLQWCRTRLSWSDSEWQRVIFSDESRFSLGGDAQRIRVWRHRGQHQDASTHVQKAWCPSTSTPTAPSAGTVWTVRDDSSSAAAQCSVGHPLVLHQWSRDAAPQDAAHRTLPTGRCPQDAAHRTLPHRTLHRTLPTGRCPTGHCPTGHRSQDTAPQNTAHRTPPHRTLLTGHRPTGRCSQDTAPQDAAHRTPPHRTLLTGHRPTEHCSQDTAPQNTAHRTPPHRTLLTGHRPTGRCSQDTAPQDAAPQDATPQDAAHRTPPHRTLPTGRCPQDAAHRTLPTGRCPQDTAHRTPPHRTLLTGHRPTGCCSQDTAPQDAAHRTPPHSTLLTGHRPTEHCSQDTAPQNTAHRTPPHRTLLTGHRPTEHCSQDTAPQNTAHRTPPHRTLLTGHRPTEHCSQDTAPQDAAPQDTAPQDAAPQDATPQDAAHRTPPHRTLLTGRCPQDAAHRTLPTGRCPQDAAPQDAAHRTPPHRTLLHRTPPHRKLLTGHRPTERCPQDAAHRTLPTGRCPQDAAPKDAAPQDAAHRTLPQRMLLHRTLPTGRCPKGCCSTGR
ncbi:hypothetical protein NFI96_004477 [Prochilodus magdalenae]|nr:hypothetical protein NFI96_004477 [Prochilodus magdalenae]